ncbi:hypothetical protein BGX34_002957 [Mortierella sp. NVP85]|nr:hypothetical protein BGX34_002957 [Mortierella sp. NVP85]
MGNCFSSLEILTAEKLDPQLVCFQDHDHLHDDEPRYNDDVPNILEQTSPVEDTLPSDVGTGKSANNGSISDVRTGKPANNGSISDEDTLGIPDTTDKKPPVDDTKLSHAESGQSVQTSLVERAQPSDVEIEQSAKATVSSEVILDRAHPVNDAPMSSGNNPHDDKTSADNAPRPSKTVSDIVQSANDDTSAPPSLWQPSNNASRSGEGIVNNLFFEQSVRHEGPTVVTPITVDPKDPMFHRRVRKDVSSPNVWQTAKMIFSMTAAASGEVVRE